MRAQANCWPTPLKLLVRGSRFEPRHGLARRRPSSKNRVLPVDLNQFDVEQLADALQVGAVVAAGVACCEVGDDDCRAAVLGVEVLAREPEMQGCPGADELAVQNRLADGVPVVAADPGAAAVDVDLYLDCP